MGSPTVSNAKPVPMENTDKKSLKELIKSLFPKKKEKQKKPKQQIHTEVKEEIKPKPDPVAAILENFNKLDLTEKKQEREIVKDNDDETENELDNFNFKIIEDHRNERIHSQSSDSGYSEKSDNSENTDKTENVDKVSELAEALDNACLLTDKKRVTKLQTVVIKRGPIKPRLSNYVPTTCPYGKREIDPFRQINQVNKITLTGGNVIVNGGQSQPDNISEVDIACEKVQQRSEFHQKEPDDYLNFVLEYINEDTAGNNLPGQNVAPYSSPVVAEETLGEPYDQTNQQQLNFEQIDSTNIEQDILQFLRNFQTMDHVEVVPNVVKDDVYQYMPTEYNFPNDQLLSAYPTPPRSENVPSPMSATSFCPTNSDYILSPERSPIYNSDYEVYQNIPHFEEEKESIEKRSSVCSMTLKQYKDMQKEIINNFSKRECCQLTRPTCKELFEEHAKKLSMAERKDLCLNVAKMDVKTAYGILLHIILSLSQGSKNEALEYYLFRLLCERILGEDIKIFTGETGLHLLKAAALRSPHKTLLTRYLIECVRTAIKMDASLAAEKDYVFHEVDSLGDTLVIACARAGDECAEVLSEIVRSHPEQPPLFKMRHYNADGYTALHVASSLHSVESSKLFTVHVLLEHAGFVLTDGDLKGRDTALHLAVNSVHCDLQLLLLMFKHADRKEWKNLAHWRNLSNKTPIDLARSATKSTSRQNYPKEILEFLKKCR